MKGKRVFSWSVWYLMAAGRRLVYLYVSCDLGDWRGFKKAKLTELFRPRGI